MNVDEVCQAWKEGERAGAGGQAGGGTRVHDCTEVARLLVSITSPSPRTHPARRQPAAAAPWHHAEAKAHTTHVAT